MKLNEHPRCSCAACRRGAGSTFGKFIHRQVNRVIRRTNKQQLDRAIRSGNVDEVERIIVSTPYTD
jgi:hypothetical protein